MDILNLILAVSEPKGMWASIIKWLQSGIGNYALTIIVLTIIIKLVMLPLDFYQRYITKVNAKKQAAIQPEIDKLNARYGNNKDVLNQKTMELYKREKYNIVGTCFGILLNLVLSMVIFFTLFSGINKMQYYTIDQEYLQLKQTYITEVSSAYLGEEGLFLENGDFNWNFEIDAEVKANAEKAVVKKYDEIKTSFLWIKSVWIPDNYKAVIPNYKDYLKNTSQKVNKDEAIEATNKLAYETVMNPLIKKYDKQWNGYMILPVFAVGLTVLSMLIPTWMDKAKAKRQGIPYVAQANNKFLVFVMPIILGIFTFFYNTVFALYIVTGSLIGIITSPLINLLSESLEKHMANKKPKVEAVSYSRKNTPVDITNMQNKKVNNNNRVNKNKNVNSSITRNVNNNTKNKNNKKK